MAAVKSVTIQIQDSSAAQLILATYSLTGGQWEAPPQPGTIIAPGQTVPFINVASTNFDSIGGNITLSPLSGGQISISWSFPFGSPVSSSVTSSSLSGIAVSSNTINGQTSNPTLQVLVSNSAAFAAFAEVK